MDVSFNFDGQLARYLPVTPTWRMTMPTTRHTLAKAFTALFLTCVVPACASDSSSGGSPPGAGGQSTLQRPANCLPNISPECVADMCRADNQNCGAASSPLDENGCYRKSCVDESDCASGETCKLMQFSRVSCGYVPEGSDNCVCGTQLATVGERMCVPDS